MLYAHINCNAQCAIGKTLRYKRCIHIASMVLETETQIQPGASIEIITVVQIGQHFQSLSDITICTT